MVEMFEELPFFPEFLRASILAYTDQELKKVLLFEWRKAKPYDNLLLILN